MNKKLSFSLIALTGIAVIGLAATNRLFDPAEKFQQAYSSTVEPGEPPLSTFSRAIIESPAGTGRLQVYDKDTKALRALNGDDLFGTATSGAGSIDLGSTGVRISTDADGAITFLGLSAGADEDITLNLDDTANTAVVSSSTGVTTLSLTSISLTAGAGINAAGGFTVRPSNWHSGGMAAQVSTDGTDTTPAVTETYYCAVFVPANATITGVSVFLGSATEGNIKVGLFNSAGAVVATSASTDISGISADTYTRVAFTATYAAVGPATYYIGLLNDNTANRFNSHTFGDFPAGKTTGETYATGFTTIASPATTFTTAQGPIASLY